MPAPDNYRWSSFAAHKISDRNALINLEVLRQHDQAAIRPDDAGFRLPAMQLACDIPFHGNGDARIQAHASTFLGTGKQT